MRSAFFLGLQPETIETRLLLFRVISPLQPVLENNIMTIIIYIYIYFLVTIIFPEGENNSASLCVHLPHHAFFEPPILTVCK